MAIEFQFDQDEGQIIIVLPIHDEPKLSGSGKSYLLASTNGNIVSDEQWRGANVVYSVNVYARAKDVNKTKRGKK